MSWEPWCISTTGRTAWSARSTCLNRKLRVMDKSLSGRRVLVVEDEMLILMIIEDMLADLGCESVTAAATVDQALALMDARVFDAAMLDVNLNGRKSYPVADALAEFFFSTGY